MAKRDLETSSCVKQAAALLLALSLLRGLSGLAWAWMCSMRSTLEIAADVTLPANLITTAKAASDAGGGPEPFKEPKVVETYGQLPLSFEANQGQFDPQVRFVSRGGGCSLFLTPTEAVLTLPGFF